MIRTTIKLACLIIAAIFATASAEERPFVVGSKTFNESVILGELIAQTGRAAGHEVEHRRQLGGSALLFSALLSGEIDAYPEYTGTLRQELLATLGLTGDAELASALAARGIRMTWPLGFNNTYAIGMRRKQAADLGISKISDLTKHPDLALGFSSEFMDRGDGWPALRDAYALPQRDVAGMEHELAYRGLLAGSLDAMDLYATDAEIEIFDLVALDDDRAFFPTYEAVILYRADLDAATPAWTSGLHRLSGRIDAPAMIAMNRRAKAERIDEGQIAGDFLESLEGFSESARDRSGMFGRLATTTRQHLILVGIPMSAGLLIAVPLGIVAAARPRPGQVILAVVGVLQTIPSLALRVLLVPLVGLRQPPALIALFLYALLPMVRSTQAGLASVSPALIASGRAIGLGWFGILRLVSLPLASRSILAGIKTSTIITIGFATLGAFIGAGGYGEPILTGIRRNDFAMILEGAIPAAMLALIVQGLFEAAERWVVPRGLRSSAAG